MSDEKELDGLEEFEDSLDEMEGEFDGLSGFGAVTNAVKFVAPVALGGGLAFGTVWALPKVLSPETMLKVEHYKWLIGAGVGAIAGVAMWKYASPTQGALTIAGAVVTALTAWGIKKLSETSVAPTKEPPTKDLGRYAKSTPNLAFGRYGYASEFQGSQQGLVM